MFNFLQPLLLAIILLLCLYSCDIGEGSKNLNDETTTYYTHIFGNVLNENIDAVFNCVD